MIKFCCIINIDVNVLIFKNRSPPPTRNIYLQYLQYPQPNMFDTFCPVPAAPLARSKAA